MNLLTGLANSGEEVYLEKNGRFYRFADPESRPKNAIDAIRRWDEIQKEDMAQIKRPRQLSVPLIPQKIFLPAVNFRSHSSETSSPQLKEPYFFCKFAHALLPQGGDVIRPKGIERLDYEGEIGVVIGKSGKYIPVEKAREFIFGYTIVDDISLRDYQQISSPPFGKDWVLGKNADTALPIGPWITPIEDFGEFPTLIETRVNGEVRQHGSTEDMIFPIEKLISRLSQVVTLAPGDLITTGTPSGVAEHTSRKFLEPGDMVEISVDRIGTLKHGVTADPLAPGQ